jgi:hypothetical protein
MQCPSCNAKYEVTVHFNDKPAVLESRLYDKWPNQLQGSSTDAVVGLAERNLLIEYEFENIQFQPGEPSQKHLSHNLRLRRAELGRNTLTGIEPCESERFR